MVPLFTGHLSASHGLLPAFKALRSMPTAARGVLVVITEQGEAELAISEQGLIIGALIRQKNEQGIFALKKILDWKNGKYAFFEGDEYPNDHIKKTLRMDIVNIIRGAEDPSSVSGGTTGANPRVDISSLHNKSLSPQQIGAAQQSATAQQAAAQAQYQSQQQPSQQQAFQQQPQQPAQQQLPQLPQPQGQQAYNQSPQLTGAQASAPNMVSQPQVPATGGKPAKKPRKFASTNFAMDVFGSEVPVAPAPKVGETVEDDLLRNLSDLNRLGPSSPAPRPTQNQAPAASAGGPAVPVGQAPMVAPGSFNPPPMPQSGMPLPQGGAATTVPSQLGRVPGSQAGLAPPGMMPPQGMPPPGIPPVAAAQQAANSSGPGNASYQHQQNVSELQRQAMADEAALMQAISSTTVPVFVPGRSPGSQGGSMISEALYSEQQIRAAQSVSGGYPDVSGYQPSQSPAPSQQLSPQSQPAQAEGYPAKQPASQLTPPVPSQLQQPAAPVPPRAISPSPSLEGKAKINPTKTLLESDLFFVDDELTGDQSEPPVPPLQSSYQQSTSGSYGTSIPGNGATSSSSDLAGVAGHHMPGDSSISGGYAPSSMSARGQSLIASTDSSTEYGDTQSPSLGANFSQTPSFGPGSGAAGASSKNPGSAILESMKKRNLGGRPNEDSTPDYTPPNLTPPQNAPLSTNGLSQFNQTQIGTGSATDIPGLMGGNAIQPKFDSQTGLPLGSQIPSQLSARSTGDRGAPNVTPGVANARARIAQSGAYANQQLDDQNISGAVVQPDISSSSTYPARDPLPESYDDIPNPQVGMATSSRIARSVNSPGEVSVKGKRDDDAAGNVARSRIRAGVTQERSGVAAFFDKNKVMVFVVGGLFLVLILVGAIIGILFAMHIIKT